MAVSLFCAPLLALLVAPIRPGAVPIHSMRSTHVLASIADAAEANVFDSLSEPQAVRRAVEEVHAAADAFGVDTARFARKFTSNLLAKKMVEAGSAGIIDECLVDEGQVQIVLHGATVVWHFCLGSSEADAFPKTQSIPTLPHNTFCVHHVPFAGRVPKA
eukprot:scaffold20120_cov32-Tisochrysis_lutea.AAC.1